MALDIACLSTGTVSVDGIEMKSSAQMSFLGISVRWFSIEGKHHLNASNAELFSLAACI
jgi:hypothetical protein